MSTGTKVAWFVGGLAAASALTYYFWPKSTTITPQPDDVEITGEPTAENPSNISTLVVAQDQTRLNAIAARQGWSSVTVNGIINDPAFTSTLQKFQIWFNQTYTPAQAAIPALLNTNGILDANTSGALIYVYNLVAQAPTPAA